VEVPMVCWSADSCVHFMLDVCVFLERNIDEILK